MAIDHSSILQQSGWNSAARLGQNLSEHGWHLNRGRGSGLPRPGLGFGNRAVSEELQGVFQASAKVLSVSMGHELRVCFCIICHRADQLHRHEKVKEHNVGAPLSKPWNLFPTIMDVGGDALHKLLYRRSNAPPRNPYIEMPLLLLDSIDGGGRFFNCQWGRLLNESVGSDGIWSEILVRCVCKKG